MSLRRTESLLTFYCCWMQPCSLSSMLSVVQGAGRGCRAESRFERKFCKQPVADPPSSSTQPNPRLPFPSALQQSGFLLLSSSCLCIT